MSRVMMFRLEAEEARVRAVVVYVAVAVMGLAACTPKDEPPIPRAEARQILLERPDIDQAVRSYEAMATDLGVRLEAAGLTSGWRDAVERADNSCSEKDFRRDGEQGFRASESILHWWRTTRITANNWPAALELMTNYAASHGFPSKDDSEEDSSDRVVSFFGQKADAMLSVRSTPTETVLGVETGCHRLAGGSVDQVIPTPQSGGHVWHCTAPTNTENWTCERTPSPSTGPGRTQ